MLTSRLMQVRFFSRYSQPILALSKKWLANWNLRVNQELPIRFGHRTEYTKIMLHRNQDDQIWINQVLADRLLIPYQDQLLVKATNYQLSLGPVVGIVTLGVIQENGFPFTTNWHHFFMNMLKHQHSRLRGGAYFVFDLGKVDWENLMVEGIFYRPDYNGSWERKTVPFPDVVYNKILSRHKEKRPETQKFFDNLYTRTRAQIFNEKYFQKWDIYERLKEIDEIGDWIPETYYNPDIKLIRYLLNRYRVVYLKPVDGYMGLGIYQLIDAGEKVIVRFRQRNENIARRYSSLEALLRREIPEAKRRNYVAQQGIALIQYNTQPLDFRVHLNKNINNVWEVTGIGAKVAGKGSITTHVKAGGMILSPEEVLEVAFPHRSEFFIEQLTEKSIAIAEALERSFNKPIGELGMDLGIDHNGKIWIFEVNSKPGRSIFHKLERLKTFSSYTNKLLLDYSIHLSDFT